MSYCRFSSDNFMCDVYVYEDCDGGFTTHVAGYRLVIPPIPKPPFSMVIVRGAEFDKKTREMVYKRKIDKVIANITVHLYQLLSKPHNLCLKIIPHKNIGLQYDSESFNDETAGECADRLEFLRKLGYNVPQFAINSLREDAKNDNN